MFHVTTRPHPAFGMLVRLELGQLVLALTGDEATTIARALEAVRNKQSDETQIYLSPIASDGEFLAHVIEEGIRLAGLMLGWDHVRALAGQLAGAAAGCR